MRTPLIIFFLTLFNINCFSQLKAYFNYCAFFSPENGPYLETYLSVIGSSVSHKKNNAGKFQGNIEITMLFRQGEEIKNFKKYNLLSPELEDTSNFINFIDQQRFLLLNGNYNFEITITDKNSSDLPFHSSQPVNIDFSKEKIFISDIEMIESYKQTTEPSILSKSGYDFVPYVSNFFPKSMEKIIFYGEIYNTAAAIGKDEKYLVNYFIETYEGKTLNNFRSFSRQTSGNVNIILSSMNIAVLPSGNYNLVIELRNKNNDVLLEKRTFFQRSNPDFQMKPENISLINASGTFADKIPNDSLEEFVKSLRPISSETEVNFVDNNFPKNAPRDYELMKKFFINFWTERNALNPEQEWNQYKQKAENANKQFGTKIRKGYETDRGRIYLKYGAPNSLIDQSLQSKAFYPYQIWHYYKTEKRTNSKFVFYNTDMVSNDYVLLHSNVLGEANDYRWVYRLQQRNVSNTNLDNPRGDDYGEDHNKIMNTPEYYWNNPR